MISREDGGFLGSVHHVSEEYACPYFDVRSFMFHANPVFCLFGFFLKEEKKGPTHHVSEAVSECIFNFTCVLDI